MTSAPSGPSLRYGSKTPSESPRPRTSTETAAYPALAKTVPRRDCRSPALPYGVRVTTAGAGSVAGKVRSAESVIPSRSGIRTLNLRVTPASVTTPDATGASAGSAAWRLLEDPQRQPDQGRCVAALVVGALQHPFGEAQHRAAKRARRQRHRALGHHGQVQ